MGLMDVLNGMQNGPRGPRDPSATGASGGGMSPIMMAVLGLLAYKAVKSFSGQPGAAPATPGATPRTLPPGQASQGMPGQGTSAGGLGDLLKGGLGGLFAGGAAGSVLSSGLNELLKQFQQAGHGSTASSWVSNEPNKPVSPDILSQVLDEDQIKTLMAHTGMSRDQLLAALSEHLPKVVNEMTPQGRLPTEDEVARMIP